MTLGNFSLSLAVKNINVSFEFYQKLGFTQFHGDVTQGWLILANGDARIGIFEKMFETNMLTFNPGWDENAQDSDPFTDIRDIQKQLKSKGIEIENEIDAASTGPASFMVMDPDGNPILIDQHR